MAGVALLYTLYNILHMRGERTVAFIVAARHPYNVAEILIPLANELAILPAFSNAIIRAKQLRPPALGFIAFITQITGNQQYQHTLFPGHAQQIICMIKIS